MDPKVASSGNLAIRASWEPPGLDFQAFGGVILGLPNRSKNDAKHELILGPGPGGPRGAESPRVRGTGRFGGPGGDYRGGYLGSESQISEHQYLSDLEA